MENILTAIQNHLPSNLNARATREEDRIRFWRTYNPPGRFLKPRRPGSPAPVGHFGEFGDFANRLSHGRGRDHPGGPSLFSNGGNSLKDNLQLAINVLDAETDGKSLVAFDEYHQGRGATGNAFAAYFSGTPVLPLVGQILLLFLLILWTRGKRFARPVPLAQVDRRSSLELLLNGGVAAAPGALIGLETFTRERVADWSPLAGTDYTVPERKSLRASQAFSL